MTQPAQPAPVVTPAAPAGDGAFAFSPEVIAEVFGDADAAAVVAPASVDPPKAEGEPAAEEPKTKGVAERIVAAKRAEARAAAARTDLETRKRALDEQRTTQEAHAAEIKLFEEDPTAFVAKKGWGPKEVSTFLEKLAGTFKPEAVEGQKLSKVEQELADLKKKLADDDLKKRSAEHATHQRAAEVEAGKAFVAHIAGAAEKYPHLTKEFTETQAIDTAFAALAEVLGHDGEGRPVTRLQAYIAQHGEPPSDDVIADHLDSIAKSRLDARANAPWRTVGNAPATAGQAPSGDQNSVPPVKGTSPRTLSRADTSQRAAAPRTKGNVWTAEDQAEADEQSLRILAAASRKL